MKSFKIEITNCDDCPIFNRDYHECCENGKHVKNHITIPEWCPMLEKEK